MARRENVTSESQTNDNGARLGNQTNFSDILLFTRSYRAFEVFFREFLLISCNDHDDDDNNKIH